MVSSVNWQMRQDSEGVTTFYVSITLSSQVILVTTTGSLHAWSLHLCCLTVIYRTFSAIANAASFGSRPGDKSYSSTNRV